MKHLQIMLLVAMLILTLLVSAACGTAKEEKDMNKLEDKTDQQIQPEQDEDNAAGEDETGNSPETDLQIDLQGKVPEEFTLEDYNQLNMEQRALFPDYFEDLEAYRQWYSRVVESAEGGRTDTEPELDGKVNLGEKAPEDFTAEDYKKLSPEEKAFFPDCFASMDAYRQWYKRVIENNG